MISEKNYYRRIYCSIRDLVFSVGDDYEIRQLDENEIILPEAIKNTLTKINNQFDYNMIKKYLINMDFILTWQKSMAGYIDYESARVASEYIIFCCVVDKIMDSQRFSSELKKTLIQYVIIDSFDYNIPLVIKEEQFKCIFNLVFDIRDYLQKYEGKQKEKIMCEINKALVSECFMSTNDLSFDIPQDKYNLLIDKSVSFESSALLLSLLSFDNVSDNQAYLIGEIFWLIDDICDLLDDYKNRRINSLLYYDNVARTMSDRLIFAAENVDNYIKLLNEKIDLLKTFSNDSVHEYIKEQIWWWLSDARRLSELQK